MNASIIIRLALFTISCSLISTGCMSQERNRAQMAKLSSGPTPCSPQSVKIEDDNFDGKYPATWTAYCDGDRYLCSAGAIGVAACSKAKE